MAVWTMILAKIPKYPKNFVPSARFYYVFGILFMFLAPETIILARVFHFFAPAAHFSSQTIIFRREAALRRVMAGKGTSYFGCPAHRDIACALPPGYQLVATLELFILFFRGVPVPKKKARYPFWVCSTSG